MGLYSLGRVRPAQLEFGLRDIATCGLQRSSLSILMELSFIKPQKAET